MNFKFLVGDHVIFRPELNRGKDRMVLVKEFVEGIFHAETLHGQILRVRSNQMIRLYRPSVAEKQVLIDERKEQKRKELEVRKARIEKNEEIFARMREFRIPLTAQGLPDRRHKPKYNASNAIDLKIKPRIR